MMFRRLPTRESSATQLMNTAMPQLTASSSPCGRRCLIHISGGRMNVTAWVVCGGGVGGVGGGTRSRPQG